MKKETKREWTALCRNCSWSGKRHSDQSAAQQEVETHLKSHPKHQVRLMVTGEDSSVVAETERNRVEEQWKLLNKRLDKG
jgi:hypothetical protein